MTDSQVEKIYNDAVNRLRAIVNEVHNRYAVNGVLVPSNLTGRVTLKDMQLLKEQYDKLPDDMTLPEKQRANLYTAISQTSRRGLVTALLGLGLALATHKVAKVLSKNNRQAVSDEIDYQSNHIEMTEKQRDRLAKHGKQVAKDSYVSVNGDIKPIPWLDRLWLNHDQILNRIDSTISKALAQGMRPEDIADKLFPGNAQSMKEDNVPKALRDASVSAKRLARTEAACREDEMAMSFFKSANVKYVDWITEPGACNKCMSIQEDSPYPIDEAPSITGDTHPNCRCRKTPHNEKLLTADTTLKNKQVNTQKENKQAEGSNSQKNSTEFDFIEQHTLPFALQNNHSNKKIVKVKDGKMITIRVYAGDNFPEKDIDLTDHGNPKRHPIVPHVHDWIMKKENGKISRKKGRAPTKKELRIIKNAKGKFRQRKAENNQ